MGRSLDDPARGELLSLPESPVMEAPPPEATLTPVEASPPMQAEEAGKPPSEEPLPPLSEGGGVSEGQPPVLASAPSEAANMPSAPSASVAPMETTSAPPAVDAPSNSGESQEVSVLPDPLELVAPVDASGFVPSYGVWQYSIMYPPTEINNLKNILALYERKGFIVEKAADQPVAEAEKPKIEDLYRQLQEKPLPANLVFPSFKLRSLMYRSANEWAVWLNNRYINNENNSPDSEVVVVDISREYVEFAWIPGNAELLSAILQLRLLPEGMAPAKKEMPEHRLAITRKSGAWLDKATSVVHFVLRPNQAFYTETFEVFEGVPSELNASIERAIQLEKDPAGGQTSPQDVQPDSIIKELQNQLGQQEQQAQPATSDDIIRNEAGQKESPKAKMMRTLGLGK